MQLRCANGMIAEARIRGKKMKPVCGDFVIAEPIVNEEDWLITAVEPRSTALSRQNQRGQAEAIAANVEWVAVVAAAAPNPDWFVIDRYLAAAEIMGSKAAVIFNKTDLEDGVNKAKQSLRVYTELGYPLVYCSVTMQQNLDQVLELLSGSVAILVGQSGVGKSSIVNAIAGDATQRISSLSDSTGEGQHTTVASVLLDLPGGGGIIDSPGVRDYAPALADPANVAAGFRELNEFGQECRFANCKHLREPNCAVLEAVANDDISERRYESYKRLLFLTENTRRKFS